MNRFVAHSVAIALAALACRLPAQQEAEAAATIEPAARVAKAIADYEALLGDPQKAPMRRQAMLWLGEIAHDDAATYLRGALRKAGDDPFAAVVCEAIARVVRPAFEEALTETLQRPAAPFVVRAAAAAALVKLGDKPIDALLKLAVATDEQTRPPIREAAIGALVDSGVDRAQRGVTALLFQGELQVRMRLLRRMENLRAVPVVTTARAKLVRESEIEIAAMAWRQLILDSPARGRELCLDMLERIVEGPTPAIAAELIGGLVHVRDADFYPVLLRYGAMRGEGIKRALRSGAKAAAEDPELLKWLVTKGLDAAQPAERDAAMLLLTQAPPAVLKPLVDRLRADLRAGKKKVAEQAAGLHELLAKDPTWRSDLAAMAASSDQETRMMGLSMLMELGAPDGLEIAQQSLGNKAWELRSLAIRYLTRVRDVSSIPLLIARYGKEEGRLAAELDQALFVHTGTRCWTKRDWDAWWAKHRTGFVLPHPESVKGGGGGGGGGKTVSYHDIPVVSSRIAFLVDRSGSMAAPLGGTDKKRTRLAEAKNQLVRVVEALPDKTMFNVVVYETNVAPMWDELRKCSAENRKEAIEKAEKIALGGGTNIFDALERALADPKVDTIYLLTDGQPSAGRIVDPEQILDEVQRLNRTRQVVIHCIGLGIDSDLLRRLSEISGGTYKFVP